MSILWLRDKLLRDNLGSSAITYQQNQDYHNTITKCINMGTEAEAVSAAILSPTY